MLKNTDKIKLVLEDGTIFFGKNFGAEKSVAGEVVFNTGMVGYPETLTDPSYKGQILTLTYPLIGNYGVPGNEKESGLLKNFESDRIQIAGLIIADYSLNYNHWSAKKSLGKWLKENNVPAMYGIDTRALTKRLRKKGTMLGKIVFKNDVELTDPNKSNLVAYVSTKRKKVYGSGRIKILLVDTGIKYNTIRCFIKRGVQVIRVPWNYNFNKEKYHGLIIANGPGDPKMCKKTISNLKMALRHSRPIFGICLGNQLLALAAGGNTYKLKYGHRSQNQPCIIKGTNRCFITSQNHGYAVDNKSLPTDWDTWFINANDNTCEGIKHKNKPFLSVQFHPEASAGPVDTEFLFDDFINLVKKWKK